MENEKQFRVIPCKYCKRGRIKVHKTNVIGSQISADPCIYCGGKGFIREEVKIEKYLNNINNNKIGDKKEDELLDTK
jgi:hypothetical protein